jgi:hypothetical protein
LRLSIFPKGALLNRSSAPLSFSGQATGGLARPPVEVYNAGALCSAVTPQAIEEALMKKTTNSKKKPERASSARNKRGAPKVDRPTARGYAVRIPEGEARLRAVMVLGEVGLPYVGFPDADGNLLYGLMHKHIEVLQDEGIPFEIV